MSAVLRGAGSSGVMLCGSLSGRLLRQPTDTLQILRQTGVLRVVEIPRELQVQPGLRLDAKQAFKSECRVGRHPAFAVHQLAYPIPGLLRR